MLGTTQKQKCGYHWMRVGYAEKKFANILRIFTLIAIGIFAVWTYRELPRTQFRLINFFLIYSIAALLYMNIGVWLHEQLHCLAFWGSIPKRKTKITYTRKNFLFLTGYYQIQGSIPFKVMRRALLFPVFLPIGLVVIGFMGIQLLPGWWLPVFLSMATAGVLDMTHDLYMVSKIQPIADKGKYWDHGKGIDVVWKIEEGSEE